MWRGWHNDFITLDTCSGCSCMWEDLPGDGQRRSLRVSKVSVCWWSWVLWNGHWTPTPKRVVTHWLRTITQKERAEMWFTGIQTLVPCPITRQKQRSYLRGPHIQAPLFGPQPHLPWPWARLTLQTVLSGSERSLSLLQLLFLQPELTQHRAGGLQLRRLA